MKIPLVVYDGFDGQQFHCQNLIFEEDDNIDKNIFLRVEGSNLFHFTWKLAKEHPKTFTKLSRLQQSQANSSNGYGIAKKSVFRNQFSILLKIRMLKNLPRKRSKNDLNL